MAAESLFCNELWLMMMTPTAEEEMHENHPNPNTNCHSSSTTALFSYSNVEDCEEAFSVFLRKEIAYAPECGYVKHVRENCWIEKARFTAIHWFVKSQRRLNLSLETVFNAANYFDRFTSLKKSQISNDWMLELLSVACLSTASKFNETNPPSLHQIQMEGLENWFESSLVQRMELNLLKSLEWRLRPTTSCSYIQLLTGSGSCIDLFRLNNKEQYLVQDQEFNARLTDLLVNALLDSKFLEFSPSVIAMSALQHISKEFVSTKDDPDSVCMGRFRALTSPDQQENLTKCYEMMMEEKLLDKNCSINNPSSPVTVLASNTHWCCDFRDFLTATDSSLLKMKNTDCSYFTGSPKKRKREETGRLI